MTSTDDRSNGGSANRASEKRLLVVSALAVAAVTVTATVFVYMSPEYSWDSSVRDHDNDGYADSSDAFPNDASRHLPLVSMAVDYGCDNWTVAVIGVGSQTMAQGVRIQLADIIVASWTADGLVSLPSTPVYDVWLSTLESVDFNLGIAPNASAYFEEGDFFVLSAHHYKSGSKISLRDSASGDEYCNQTLSVAPPAFYLTRIAMTHVFEWNFQGMSGQVMWEDIVIELSDGTDEVRWTPWFVDYYTGSTTNGFRFEYDELPLGDISVVCVVESSVSTGYIQDSDSIELTTSLLPHSFLASEDYTLGVVHEVTDVQVGGSFHGLSPSCDIDWIELDYGVEGTLNSVWLEVSWTDVTITLSDGTETVTWTPLAEDLDDGVTTESIFPPASLGSLTVFLNITDSMGDGCLSSMDVFTLTTSGENEFDPEVTYIATIIYEQSLAVMYSETVPTDIPIAPTCDITRTRVNFGWKLMITQPTGPCEWSDVSIQLSDGVNTVVWEPTTESLDGGNVAIQHFLPVLLGDLTVFCNVTDLAGDGLMGGSDYFTLTTLSSNTFTPGTTYTVTLVFEPTAEVIGSEFWTG